jgi:formate hydrogenlyase subunit 6/NADH:ubiquinone oxidoreductase subunit I
MTATPQTPQATAAPGSGGGEIITVKRPDGSMIAGQGMLQGMLAVIRHFGKSFTTTSLEKTDNVGMFNVQYPEERMALPEAFRNMPVLLYDDATGQELCTSCFQCERICPPKVIHITQASDPKTGKPVPAAEEFVIEYDSCMSCGLCAEVCPFDAIKMDHDYELSTPDHLGLDVHKAALNRPISYYKLIAPNLWADVQAQALKKLGNNVKRRSGNIGVAPHLWGKQLAAAAPVAGAARAAQAKPSTPVAAIGKTMAPEKIARLEAIRAAKRGGAPGSAEGAPSAEALAGETVAEAGTHMTESQADTPAQAVAATGPVAAVGANMSDEKKARLEAIRAAKRAQGG